jgi:hypothetical protein
VKGNKSDLNNVRCEISRHFKNKKKEYLKDKSNDPAVNSKKKKNIRDLCRGINEFKRGYQPQSNLVKDDGDLLADSHNILNRWKNYVSQLLNMHSSVRDVRQIEIHAAESLVHGLNPSEVEIAVVNLKCINCQVVIKFQQN